jgi:hypothetical protein
MPFLRHFSLHGRDACAQVLPRESYNVRRRAGEMGRLVALCSALPSLLLLRAAGVPMYQASPHCGRRSSSRSLFWCSSGRAKAWNNGATRWASSAVPAFVFQDQPSIRGLASCELGLQDKEKVFDDSFSRMFAQDWLQHEQRSLSSHQARRWSCGARDMSLSSRFDEGGQSSFLRNQTLFRLDEQNRQKRSALNRSA